MEIQTEILDMPPFAFSRKPRLFFEQLPEEGEPSECLCPEGLSDTYNVNISGTTYTLTRTAPGACSWCGRSDEDPESAHTYELYLTPDTALIDVECGWDFSQDDGVIIFSKEYDSGNPVGSYRTDTPADGTRTIAEGAGTINIPC